MKSKEEWVGFSGSPSASPSCPSYVGSTPVPEALIPFIRCCDDLHSELNSKGPEDLSQLFKLFAVKEFRGENHSEIHPAEAAVINWIRVSYHDIHPNQDQPKETNSETAASCSDKEDEQQGQLQGNLSDSEKANPGSDAGFKYVYQRKNKSTTEQIPKDSRIQQQSESSTSPTRPPLRRSQRSNKWKGTTHQASLYPIKRML